MAMTPNPDFEHFVRDYLQLAGKEKSRELRNRVIGERLDARCDARPARSAATPPSPQGQESLMQMDAMMRS